MMSLWDALRMNMMISYQELVRTFLKNMTLDEINNTYCNNDYYNQAIREEPIDLLDRSFSSSSWPF